LVDSDPAARSRNDQAPKEKNARAIYKLQLGGSGKMGMIQLQKTKRFPKNRLGGHQSILWLLGLQVDTLPDLSFFVSRIPSFLLTWV